MRSTTLPQKGLFWTLIVQYQWVKRRTPPRLQKRPSDASQPYSFSNHWKPQLPLETATYISDLVTSNPAASDGLNNADDHMRLIKATLQATFPGVVGQPLTRAVTSGQGVLLGVGSAAAPALAFSGRPDMGLYAIDFTVGVDAWGFTGVLRGNGAVPAGMIEDFGGATPPTGWLACDGQAVSRTTFATLFNAIGTTWGAGNGSTTFNVPNLLSRFRRHRDNASLSGGVGLTQGPCNLIHTHPVIGGTGGADTDHSHTFSGTTSSMNRSNPHTHSSNANITGVGSTTGGGGFGIPGVGAATINSTDINHEHTYSGTTSGFSAQHAHAISFTSGIGSADNGAEARPYSATVLTCIKT